MNCENEAKKEIGVTNHIEVGHNQFAFDLSKTKIISQKSVDTVYVSITMLPT